MAAGCACPLIDRRHVQHPPSGTATVGAMEQLRAVVQLQGVVGCARGAFKTGKHCRGSCATAASAAIRVGGSTRTAVRLAFMSALNWTVASSHNHRRPPSPNRLASALRSCIRLRLHWAPPHWPILHVVASAFPTARCIASYQMHVSFVS